MTEMRKIGKQCLSQCLSKKKNINLFEKIVYNLALNNSNNYFQIMYDVCGDILKKKSLKKIFKELELGKYKFNTEEFNKFRNEQQEQDEFVENPFEVSEGVLECTCGSNKTISYPLQTRSGDEKTSVYVCCVQCGKKWVE